MDEVVKCRYCGKTLKSIASRNMGCGPECLRKHYKPRTLLDAIEQSKNRKLENKVMTRNEIVKMMKERGYSLYCETVDDNKDEMGELTFTDDSFWDNQAKKEVTISLLVKFNNKTNEKSFKFAYSTITGCLTLSTGFCSPFTDEEHFNTVKRVIKEFAQLLYDKDREKQGV